MKRAWVAIALGALLGSCGETRSDGGSGSNTNWLQCASDSDCPSGHECWCNTCAETCTQASDCAGASCAPAVDYGCGEQSRSPELCILPCESNADCAERGKDSSCVNGACLATSAPASGGSAGSGSGGTSSEGGSGGGGDSALEPNEPQSGAGGEGAETGGSSGEAGSGGSGGGAPPAGPPLDESALRPLSLAQGFGCLIREERVYCWGNDDFGQLGVMPGLADSRPRIEVPGIERARSVAVSQKHACALTESGDVYCWGLDDRGQLGESSAALKDCSDAGTVPCRPTPSRVEGIGRAVEVAVIDGLSCARLEGGDVSCWGELSPAISDWTASVRGATSIALGAAGACATVGDGSLACSFDLPRYARDWRGLHRVAMVAMVEAASSAGLVCALGVLDEVLCFGDNGMGQLGVEEGDEGGAAVAEGASAVSLGWAHACALDAGGTVRCWGRNHGGALGAPPYTVPNCGPANCSRTPIAVEGLPKAVAIASESDRNCALTEDGTLWCWGIESAGWGPTREPGPWEAGGETCSDVLLIATERRYFQALQFVSACDVAEDCEELSLDLPCDHTCATIPVSRADESNGRQWDGVETACPATEAGCASPALSCAPSNTRLFCNNGSCDRYDWVRANCDDPCACDVARLPNPAFRDECPGFDLQVFYVGNCSTCDRVGLHVALTNRGSAAFSGNVTISFDGGEPLPAPLTTVVSVAPGEVTAPLVFQTDGVGGGKEAYLRVTADGDCNPSNDATWLGVVPNTSAACSVE